MSYEISEKLLHPQTDFVVCMTPDLGSVFKTSFGPSPILCSSCVAPLKSSMFGILFVISKVESDAWRGKKRERALRDTTLTSNEMARMDEERGLGSDVDERMWNAAKSPCVNKQIC